MTVALAVVGAVALGALVALALVRRSAGRRLAEAESRAATSEAELTRRAEEERLRASAAEQVRDAAEERASKAEARASEAEDSLAELRGRQGDGAIAEIEKSRLRREWAEVAGPGQPLPVPLDGRVANALAVELEIIREVIGTPSSIEDRTGESPQPWTLVALGAELLRIVARAADEMIVGIGGEGGAPSLTIEAVGAGAAPDLSSIEPAVSAAGASLELDPSDGGFRVKLGC